MHKIYFISPDYFKNNSIKSAVFRIDNKDEEFGVLDLQHLDGTRIKKSFERITNINNLNVTNNEAFVQILNYHLKQDKEYSNIKTYFYLEKTICEFVQYDYIFKIDTTVNKINRIMIFDNSYESEYHSFSYNRKLNEFKIDY